MEKLMKEKNDFITNISNRCLKLIASNKINMVDIAYKMGIRTIDLYKTLFIITKISICYFRYLFF